LVNQTQVRPQPEFSEGATTLLTNAKKSWRSLVKTGYVLDHRSFARGFLLVECSREETLRIGPRSAIVFSFPLVLATVLSVSVTSLFAQSTFRNAPASATHEKNPLAGRAAAAAAGKKLYAQDCAQCHGNNRQGMGPAPAPALNTPHVRNAKAGELFWFITTGKTSSGMPSWSSLPQQDRWQVVTFLQSRSSDSAAAK
jgi:mono/diheme cytochrome c family protein